MFPRGVLVLNRSSVTIRHLGYSGLNRQLDLLQQVANVLFDHCDLISFLPFEGDLVMEKVQG